MVCHSVVHFVTFSLHSPIYKSWCRVIMIKYSQMYQNLQHIDCVCGFSDRQLIFFLFQFVSIKTNRKTISLSNSRKNRLTDLVNCHNKLFYLKIKEGKTSTENGFVDHCRLLCTHCRVSCVLSLFFKH